MAFPRKLLNDNEEVVLDLRPHWIYMAEPTLAVIGSILLGLLAWQIDVTFIEWLAVALVRRDRFDPVRFNPAESVGFGLSSGNVAHLAPSAGITQFRFMRSAHRRPLSPLVGASSRWLDLSASC